jgi:hypothetical protein
MSNTQATEMNLLKEISEKLDRLIAVTAIAGKDEDEHADLLINLGIDAKIISSITGLTTNAVAIRKTRLNKGRRSGKQN